MFTVELRPHKGTKATKLGPVEVTLPQDMILVHLEDESTVFVGYVLHAGSPKITLIVKGLEDSQLEEIKRQVDELRAEKDQAPTSGIGQLRSISDNQYKVVTDEEGDDITEEDL